MDLGLTIAAPAAFQRPTTCMFAAGKQYKSDAAFPENSTGQQRARAGNGKSGNDIPIEFKSIILCRTVRFTNKDWRGVTC